MVVMVVSVAVIIIIRHGDIVVDLELRVVAVFRDVLSRQSIVLIVRVRPA